MNTNQTLTTPELRAGDTVHCHGLRCLIDGTPRLSRNHPGGQTFWYPARVLNPESIGESTIPASFIRTRDDGQPSWTIQGNQYARWSVDRPSA